MLHLGMHTDNWRTLSGSFEQAIDKAVELELGYVEFGVVDGQDFIQGLGYAPTVSLDSNPIALRRYLDSKGVRVSQIDAGYPVFGPGGATHGVRYVQRAIQYAAAVGCPYIDTTDGQFKPKGYTDAEVLQMSRENYRQILSWAEDYNVTVNIEPHGPYTTNLDVLEQFFRGFESSYLGLNFDTGNTYISGNDPVEFLRRLLPYLRHLHVKDVPLAIADTAGESTGIAMSDAAIGAGANAKNIRRCIDLMSEAGWDGVLSVECLGLDSVLRSSIDWLREAITAAEAGVRHEA